MSKDEESKEMHLRFDKVRDERSVFSQDEVFTALRLEVSEEEAREVSVSIYAAEPKDRPALFADHLLDLLERLGGDVAQRVRSLRTLPPTG